MEIALKDMYLIQLQSNVTQYVQREEKFIILQQKQCECPEGTVEDREGNCVAKPCEGDPVRNPEIVSSGTSGKKGGYFWLYKKTIK